MGKGTAMSAPYTLIRSDRKTLSLEISPALELIVRAPRLLPDAEIQRFIAAHAGWIDLHIQKQRQRLEAHPEPSGEERAALIARAKEQLPPRVAYYARQMGLFPEAVTITGAKTRFGSCSDKNRICFSWRLMQYPPRAVDYVVVHELAHIRHKNHSRAFYELVASVLPDYKQRRELLRL